MLLQSLLSYDTIVLYYSDREGLGFPESNLSPKTQLKFYLLTAFQYCLGIANPKNVFRSIQKGATEF